MMMITIIGLVSPPINEAPNKESELRSKLQRAIFLYFPVLAILWPAQALAITMDSVRGNSHNPELKGLVPLTPCIKKGRYTKAEYKPIPFNKVMIFEMVNVRLRKK